MRIGFDLDGVLATTPFGRFAVHAPSPVADLPDGYERLYDAPPTANPLRLVLEYVRFGWRRLAPGAEPVLRELARRHECFIITGRSVTGERVVRGWLRRTGLHAHVVGVEMAPKGLRPAQHKLAVANRLGIDAHIDDDPRTAYHLARNSTLQVYLLEHAGTPRDAGTPQGIVRVRSLREYAHAIDAESI